MFYKEKKTYINDNIYIGLEKKRWSKEMWPDLREAYPSIIIGAGMEGMYLMAMNAQACLIAIIHEQVESYVLQFLIATKNDQPWWHVG